MFKNIKVNYTEDGNGCYLGNTENPYLVLVQVKDKTVTSCTIHASTVIIAGDAFSNSAITEITIPDSVKFIGRYAFSGSKLERLNLASIDDWCVIKSETEKTYTVIRESNSYWSSESANANEERRATIVRTSSCDMFREGFLPSYTKE